MEIRRSKTAFFSAVLFFAVVQYTWSATFNVPTAQYPTIASALSACNPGDDIYLVGDVSETGFTMNKDWVYILGNYRTISTTGTINFAANNCAIVEADIYGNISRLIRINDDKQGTYFRAVRFMIPYYNTTAWIIDDYGSRSVSFQDCDFLNGNRGVDAMNYGSYYVYDSYFSNCYYDINCYTSESTNSQISLGTTSFRIVSATSSNPACIRSSRTSSSGQTSFSLNASAFEMVGGVTTGAYPIKFVSRNSATVTNNDFNYCPNGAAWTKTTTDVISASGNDYINGCYQP